MEINWSEQSRDDLREIVSYVVVNFGTRKAAEVLAGIRAAAEQLADFPLLGKRFVEDKELGIVYRSLSCRLNRIVYYIEGDTVNIVTVWQNRRDVTRLVTELTQDSSRHHAQR